MKPPQVLILVGVLITVSSGVVAAVLVAIEGVSAGIEIVFIVGGLGLAMGLFWVGLGLYLQRLERLQTTINEQGLEATATIINVAINRWLRINQKYPYRIVAYTFQAGDGQIYSARKMLIPVQVVEEKALTVGGAVTIRYLPHNPNQSTVALD